MKKYILISILIIAAKAYALTPSKNEVRTLFMKASTEAESCKQLITMLYSFNEQNNAVLAGYKACATMMNANYVTNPISKWSHFTEGKTLLEKAINADKTNIELRFLRFAAQSNAPSFLNYNTSINDDKKYLLKEMVNVKDEDLKKLIREVLLRSSYVSKTEKLNI